MKYSNGYFQLLHKENGTYMKLYPAQNGGTPISYNKVTAYLSRIKITDYNMKVLSNAILEATEIQEIQLNTAVCYPEDEFLEIIADEFHLKAVGVFYPPSSKGKLLTKQEIISNLVRSGIKFGVIEQNIEAFLENRLYCTEIDLAQALQPVQGKSAEIEYMFKTEGLGKPKINEDGSVDFHQLDMINNVKALDVLAVLTPVDYGKPGLDIYGNVIKPVKVIPRILRYGSNIHLSEDKLTMYSDVAGHVSLVGDRVFVSDTYEVPADVSVASGDIEYAGNVLVRGNVVTGFTVKAEGDIIVEGVVEGATLIAKGQIILKRGIQGMGKGKLLSDSNITARFIENCNVISGGSITTETIMHSYVTAKGEILVTGKRSMITGGEVKSAKGITSKILGSTMCTQTVVAIGLDDNIMKEYKALEKEMDDIKEEQKKFVQVFAILKKRVESGKELTVEQKKQAVTAKQGFTKLQENFISKEQRYMQLKIEVDNFKGGRIKFTGSVYPGVKIVISSASMYVKDEVSHGQFVVDRADIRVIAL